VFDDAEINSLADADGTLHVTFFSNRLAVLDPTTGAYDLFHTSTRDGKTWAPLRLIRTQERGGWPRGLCSLLRGPDDKCWIFWRNRAGSAARFEDIADITPITFEKPVQGSCMTPHVVFHDGRFHMTFDTMMDNIYYSDSTNGQRWSTPVPLLSADSRGPTLRNIGLIELDQGRLAALYNSNGTRLRLFSENPAKVADSIRIVRENCSRPLTLPDGRVILLPTGTCPWMLQATPADLKAWADDASKTR
jgi:hypothetical protein